MILVRLFDTDAPDGEEMSGEFEMSVLPDAGDRIVLETHEGDVADFEVLGRTFEVVFGEEGEPAGETRVTIEVERAQLEPDEEEQGEEQEQGQ